MFTCPRDWWFFITDEVQVPTNKNEKINLIAEDNYKVSDLSDEDKPLSLHITKRKRKSFSRAAKSARNIDYDEKSMSGDEKDIFKSSSGKLKYGKMKSGDNMLFEVTDEKSSSLSEFQNHKEFTEF